MRRRTVNIIVSSNQINNLRILPSLQALKSEASFLALPVRTYLVLNNMFETVNEPYTVQEVTNVPVREVIGKKPIYDYDSDGNIKFNSDNEPIVIEYEDITTINYKQQITEVEKMREVERPIPVELNTPELNSAFDVIINITDTKLATMTDIRLYSINAIINEGSIGNDDYVWFIDSDDELTLNMDESVSSHKTYYINKNILQNMKDSDERDCFYFGKYNYVKGESVPIEVNSCTSEVDNPFNAICENVEISNYFWEYIFKVNLCRAYLFESPKVNLFDETPIIQLFMQKGVESSRKFIKTDIPIYNYIRADTNTMSAWDKPWEYYAKPTLDVAKWMKSTFASMNYLDEYIFKFLNSRLGYILKHFTSASIRVSILDYFKDFCESLSQIDGSPFFVKLVSTLKGE